MSPARSDFGAELRRRRNESEKSLVQLAGEVHISKSYLSKIERGLATPSGRIARSLDVKLHAKGELAALLAPGSAEERNGDLPPSPHLDAAPWSFLLYDGGEGDFTSHGPLAEPPGRAPAVVAHSVITPGSQGALEESVLPVFHTLFHAYRRLGQLSGPGAVIPLSTAATATLRGLGRGTSRAHRGAALRLAARFAEYTGWMWQEAGDDRAAQCWTDHAAGLAEAGGDQELVAYALLRRAELALYRDDSLATVELARAAGARARGPRIKALAAQREAQGHALLGDEDACRRALDRGADLVHEPWARADGAPALGGTHLPDLTAFVTGWCLRELGRPEQAVALLDTGRDAIAPHAARARARHSARLALALIDAGEVERGCAVAESAARDVMTTDSATVRTDVRQLRSVLTSRSRRAVVRDVLPVIAASLSGNPVPHA
ncbi:MULTISPECIES: helix-turn-helix domain-containing protein [unclassified Streptomyces]|uniref:helix-turn-helix domain-containing protein n=1 Tax=unclassified Streptomyces TaxID=2593676 RepID=UPI002E2D3598|nr:helix-turn-helix transcriptional regulator [Streptomyces sp. NBC_01439]